MLKNYQCSRDIDLYSLIQEQKKAYHKDKLSAERKALLEAMNIEWLTLYERAWKTHLEFAAEYSRAHGDLDMCTTYRDDGGFQLGQRLRTQRKNKDKLTRSLVQRPTELGMER